MVRNILEFLPEKNVAKYYRHCLDSSVIAFCLHSEVDFFFIKVFGKATQLVRDPYLLLIG